MIRDERDGDEAAIAALISQAFATAPHSNGSEAKIVDDLRAAGALTLSLVAEQDDRIVGHVAFSPVAVGGENRGWFGLGPVAVHPEHQGEGLGAKLIEVGLAHLRAIGARGCVLLGEPAYYRRFGFAAEPRLVLTGAPSECFLALRLNDEEAEGEVTYHPAFSIG